MLGSHKAKLTLHNSSNGLENSNIKPKGLVIFKISRVY